MNSSFTFMGVIFFFIFLKDEGDILLLNNLLKSPIQIFKMQYKTNNEKCVYKCLFGKLRFVQYAYI